MAEQIQPGDSVVYRPHPGAPAEDGVVVRMSDDPSLAFVRYRGSETPMATRVADLTRAAPLARDES